MKIVIVALSCLLLMSCPEVKQNTMEWGKSDEGKPIKVSIESDHYRIFCVNSEQSLFVIKASEVGLKISDIPKFEYYTRAAYGGLYKYKKEKGTLWLTPCSKYRDTLKYTLKESSSDSSVILIYNSNSSSKEYKYVNEQLEIPCIND